MENIYEDLLEYWKERCLSQTLIYQFKPQYKKEHIIEIYSIFRDNFNTQFFYRSTDRHQSILNGNWLHALLLQPEHPGSYYAIQEFAWLVKYMNNYLPSDIIKRFFSYSENMRRLRDASFELFTFRLLHKLNKIPIGIALPSGQKTPEGFCTINNQKYLFECKNIVLHSLEVLDRYMVAFHEIYFQIKNIVRIKGVLGSLKLESASSGLIKEKILAMVRDFVNFYKSNPSNQFPYEIKNSYGHLKVTDYDPSEELALTLLPDQFHVMFRLRPPVIPDYERYPFETAIALNISVPEKKLRKKLQDLLSTCKSHHQNEAGRIFFINNESVNDIILPMYKLEASFPEQWIQKYYTDNFNQEDAIVFVFRDYTQKQPTIRFKVFSADEKLKAVLQNLKTGLEPSRKPTYNFPPGFIKSIREISLFK